MTTFSNDSAALLYNERYEQYGRDIRTVGWSNDGDQTLRFDTLFRGLNPKGKTVLDVGCGLGDLVPYLDRITNGDFKYIGVDVASKLIDDSKAVHSRVNCSFHAGDIFSIELPKVDISILSGSLSLKREGIEAYAHETLKKMIELSREAVSLNFLSSYADYEADNNQHYNPNTIFSWAKDLSARVNLIHDYPLYEFTVQVFI